MSEQELKQKVMEWFKKSSREGSKTKFYMKDVVKALSGEYEKRDIQKAINDCIAGGELKYWSTGSSTMLVLPEFFKE